MQPTRLERVKETNFGKNSSATSIRSNCSAAHSRFTYTNQHDETNCAWSSVTDLRRFGLGQPASWRIAGTATRLKVTALLTGLPGSPKTSICLVSIEPRTRASRVAKVKGLPGFISTCNLHLYQPSSTLTHKYIMPPAHRDSQYKPDVPIYVISNFANYN